MIKPFAFYRVKRVQKQINKTIFCKIYGAGDAPLSRVNVCEHIMQQEIAIFSLTKGFSNEKPFFRHYRNSWQAL